MKKNIYLIQPTFMNSSSLHFPYAVGALASYAWKFEDISDNYNLKKVLFMRDKISKVVDSLEVPYLIGFSNYIWNFEYNKELAKAVKSVFPECIIVFGGPQIPESSELLEEHSYIDILIHFEGEVPFRDLLRAYLNDSDLHSVSNISFRADDNSICTTEVRVFDVKDFPSPYESGFFDRLCDENPDVDFIPLIETNRGCPNRCSYCSWGKIKSGVRFFPLSRVYADIEWVSNRKMVFLGFADANFGMFPRDEFIAEKIIECRNKNGYPEKFQVSYSKDSEERVFEISKKLNEHSMDKGVTLSFQSMSETVQRNIGRSNMDIESYKKLLRKYSEAQIPTYSDLILGLPGETYESFKSGFDELLEYGQHTSLFVHLCEWLPLAEMGKKEYMDKYQIRFSEIPLNQPHRSCTSDDDIGEFSRIVTSTYSMTTDMWKEMVLYSTCVLCFHHLGLMQLVAIYLHHEKGVKYSEFYSGLLDFILKKDGSFAVFDVIRQKTDEVIENHGSVVVFDEMFGDVAWPFEEYAFLKIVSQKELFYKEIDEFIKQYIPDDNMRSSLIGYQNFVVKTVNVKEYNYYGDYDWRRYFASLILMNKKEPLLKKKVHYRVVDSKTVFSWDEYAKKVLWFGRRGGKNIFMSEIIEAED